MNRTRVMVTGLGPVTSIGVGATAFHHGQLAAVSGIRRSERPIGRGPSAYPLGEIDLPPGMLSRRHLATADRYAQLALIAARLAVEDAGLDLATGDPSRVGVVIGTGVGGTRSFEDAVVAVIAAPPRQVGARVIPKVMCNSAAAMVAVEHHAQGPAAAPVLACASGAEALVTAYQMIMCGEADVVLAGGAEAPLTVSVINSFAAMRALAPAAGDPAVASRPFSADRAGFVLAEGAAVLVLESGEHARARGARVHAELAGYGRSTDAFHITAPLPDGSGAARAMGAALRHARLTPADIDYVNAHGTATLLNDAAEVAALRAALGEAVSGIPVSSTKSQTGHSLGAAGAIEAVAAVQAVSNGIVPPTINLRTADPTLDLDFVADGPRETKVMAALSNSFAFGGHNVVLAFTRA